MNTPVRVQRKRTRGWKMPPNTVYVGRPTKYGNPFIPDFKRMIVINSETGHETPCPTREAVRVFAVQRYRDCLFTLYGQGDKLAQFLAPLRGKNLACFCPVVDNHGDPVLCHANVLLELANKEVT